MQPDRIQRPDWYDKDHTEWPTGAQVFYDLLIIAARRRQAAEAKTQPQTPAPAA
jgi:hypothetical protein